MADQPSLTAAMDNLRLVQGTSPPLPTEPRTAQNPPSRPPHSSIMGKWEHDRFGMNSNPRAGSTIRREVEKQERSTVSSWRDFAQSHTSKPLPPLRGRNAGNSGEGVWRIENRRAECENECVGPRVPGLTLPTLPTLPIVPAQGQNQAATRRPSQPTLPPQSHLTTPAAPQAIPRNQALHKRKSERYLGQNGDISTEEPQPKKASPDRPSPLSAAFARNHGVAAAGAPPAPRGPNFEQWISSRSRPHIVAPNGTTIIPFQPRVVNSQQPPRPCPAPEATTPISSATTPANQARTSSLNPTPSISLPQSPSFPSQITPSTTPSMPGASAIISPASNPPKSRGKTTDDMARRMIFAGIGAGRVPKRTEEELRKRQEEQERRRMQREEREKLGKEEIMKWSGIQAVKVETKPATQVIAREDLIKPTAMRSNVNELTQFNGEDIQW